MKNLYRHLVFLTFNGLFMFLLSFSSLAQERSHRLSLKAGYGIGSIPQIFHNFLSLGSVEWETTNKVGPWQLGASYAISRKLEVGLVATKAQMKDDGRYRTNPDQAPSPDDGEVIRKKTTNYYSVMPYVQVNWKTKEKVQAYSGYAQGWGISHVDEYSRNNALKRETYRGLAFQITAVGVRYGKRVAGYAELGFGFQGLLNGGVTVKL